MIRTAVVLAVALTFSGLSAQDPEAGTDHELVAEHSVEAGPFRFLFATETQARSVLSTKDLFVREMSPFDRKVRMGSEDDPGEKAFLRFASDQARGWPADQRAAVSKAINSIKESLDRVKQQKVRDVLLVHTNGKEESGAAYTRGQAIILPERRRGNVVASSGKLIAHELFHVLSRGDEELRDRLYRRIGFRRVGDIELPEDLRDRKLTNPDAPRSQHVIDLAIDEDKKMTVTPVLFAKRPYRRDGPRSLFAYLEFRLMETMPIVGKRYVGKVSDGKTVLHAPNLPDFHRQIGRNTNYIVHPEEILADNFSIWVTGRDDVNDPWLIDAIEETFVASSKEVNER